MDKSKMELRKKLIGIGIRIRIIIIIIIIEEGYVIDINTFINILNILKNIK